MELMDHKRGMIQMLIEMLKKASADEMDKDASGLKIDAIKVVPGHGEPDGDEPEPEMAEHGSPVLPLHASEEEKEDPEEENVPAIAQLRRRK